MTFRSRSCHRSSAGLCLSGTPNYATTTQPPLLHHTTANPPGCVLRYAALCCCHHPLLSPLPRVRHRLRFRGFFYSGESSLIFCWKFTDLWSKLQWTFTQTSLIFYWNFSELLPKLHWAFDRAEHTYQQECYTGNFWQIDEMFTKNLTIGIFFSTFFYSGLRAVFNLKPWWGFRMAQKKDLLKNEGRTSYRVYIGV